MVRNSREQSTQDGRIWPGAPVKADPAAATSAARLAGDNGLFRGVLAARARWITDGMKIAADTIAAVAAAELRPEAVVPGPLDPAVAPAVADADVPTAARADDVCRGQDV